MSTGWQHWCGLLCAMMMLGGCGDAELDRLDAQLAALTDQPPTSEWQRVTDTGLDLDWLSNHHRPQVAGRSPFRADDEHPSLEMSSMELPDSTLSQYALDQLELRGTLARGDRYWALVVAPDGHLHRLGVAQRLGRDGWKIVAIDGESMTIVARGATGDQVAEKQTMWLGTSRGDS